MSDPLAYWWTHPCQVTRYSGTTGAYGQNTTTTATVVGKVADGAVLVEDQTGQTITAEARVAFPADTDLIPLQSTVTLPSMFGPNRTHRVVKVAVGGQPLPHMIVWLK